MAQITKDTDYEFVEGLFEQAELGQISWDDFYEELHNLKKSKALEVEERRALWACTEQVAQNIFNLRNWLKVVERNCPDFETHCRLCENYSKAEILAFMLNSLDEITKNNTILKNYFSNESI